MLDAYIALGDSISIDSYPAFDAERVGIRTHQAIGSAALLYKNEDRIFPEFKGKDLVSLFPKISYVNLAIDGGVTADMLSPIRLEELSQFRNAKALITLTIGGNDLLSAYRRFGALNHSSATDELLDICNRYQKIVRMLKQKLPFSKIIATTVFDPTDSSGILPTIGKDLPLGFLDSFNTWIKKCATSECILLADIHKHFLGHGLSAQVDDCWYLRTNPIEPGYKGASEIRRVWLQTLNA